MRLHSLALAGTLLLASCTTLGPDFKRPRVPWLDTWLGGSLKQLIAVTPPTPRPPATPQWWRNFNDPALDQLIAEAQRLSPDVRTAGLRIMEARAQLGIAGSTLYPQVQQVTGELLWAGERRADAKDISALNFSAGFRRCSRKSAATSTPARFMPLKLPW